MSTSVTTRVEGVVVVTHVHPAPQGAQVPGAPQGAGHQNCGTIQKFSKSWPIALGTVQIMVGLIVLLFGIAMAVDADSIGVLSGIFIWGAVFYIAAGALTVAAGKYLHRSLVNAGLALCVMAALVSATAVIFYSVDAARGTFNCSSCPWHYHYYSHEIGMQGISGVLAFFNFLQLVVSLVVAGRACNATCHRAQETASVVVVPAAPVAAARAAPEDQAACVPAAELSSERLDKEYEQLGDPGVKEPPIYISIDDEETC